MPMGRSKTDRRKRERGREWEREKAVEEEKKSEMVGRSRSDVRAGKGSQRGESINAKQSFELTSPLPLLLKPPIVFLLAHAPHVTLHCSTNGALTHTRGRDYTSHHHHHGASRAGRGGDGGDT